jgi:hypothetical protein
MRVFVHGAAGGGEFVQPTETGEALINFCFCWWCDQSTETHYRYYFFDGGDLLSPCTASNYFNESKQNFERFRLVVLVLSRVNLF